MKIHNLAVLSLTLCSTGALAFQSKPLPGHHTPAVQTRALEDNIASQFYSHQGTPGQATPLGTCPATPVPGCNCALCSQLRNRG
ncbi:hypothetical protein F9C28_06530 [Shimwellia pseudoproteus]|uniref:hypothetical protein n=1 Tax=Shimwellia pseudoproteus TaxID=570012 RepID=UPI0018EB7308|nr:hypothetical protein [Shimwellia pseudoproteus]MBJ3814588.1 hypothetical protein [Shimwellia pseudoproteus]